MKDSGVSISRDSASGTWPSVPGRGSPKKKNDDPHENPDKLLSTAALLLTFTLRMKHEYGNAR